MNVEQFLKPGDVLLYGPKGFKGAIIAFFSHRPIAHCEGYAGMSVNGRPLCVASRDGEGVNLYPLRRAELVYVLRPKVPFQLEPAMAWFATVKGQKYDWIGLLRFVTLQWKRTGGKPSTGMFCSSFLTRWQRKGGVYAFSVDADSVTPADYRESNDYWIHEVSPNGQVADLPVAVEAC